MYTKRPKAVEHWSNTASCPAELEESGRAGVICTVMDVPCCFPWQGLFSCDLLGILATGILPNAYN